MLEFPGVLPSRQCPVGEEDFLNHVLVGARYPFRKQVCEFAIEPLSASSRAALVSSLVTVGQVPGHVFPMLAALLALTIDKMERGSPLLPSACLGVLLGIALANGNVVTALDRSDLVVDPLRSLRYP